MTRKLNLNLVPLGVAAVTAMMFAPLVANAAGIIDQFGGQATAVSPGLVRSPVVSSPVATTPAVSTEVLQRFEDVLAAARAASATTTETSSSDGSGSTGNTTAVSPYASPTPYPVATVVSPSHVYNPGAYVSTAPPGEHVPPYFKSAIATPDSVQVLGSGAPVNRYVAPRAPAAPAASAYAPGPVVYPYATYDAPVAVAAPAWTPPNWDAPVAAPVAVAPPVPALFTPASILLTPPVADPCPMIPVYLDSGYGDRYLAYSINACGGSSSGPADSGGDGGAASGDGGGP